MKQLVEEIMVSRQGADMMAALKPKTLTITMTPDLETTVRGPLENKKLCALMMQKAWKVIDKFKPKQDEHKIILIGRG